MGTAQRLATIVLGACLLGGLLAGSGASASPPPRGYVPGEVLVRFERQVPAASRAQLRSDLGARLQDRLPVPGLELLELPAGADVASAVARLQRSPFVLYAEPNFVVREAATPNDARFGSQWALHNTGQSVLSFPGTADADIDAPAAWDVTTGSSGTVVAVVDSGIDVAHPQLASNLWSNPNERLDGRDNDGNGHADDIVGWDFIDDDAFPVDGTGHGTHVAGVIGAATNDATATAGIAWDTSLMAVRALDDNGVGDTATMASALTYAARSGARVVNASFGSDFYSRAIADAIAAAPQSLFVAAAGNAGRNVDTDASYPCALDLSNVICVAATDDDDALLRFSNFGATTVDIGAPGQDILSTTPTTLDTDGLEYRSGTSMATPHVSGAAALLWSHDASASVGEVRSALLSGGDARDALTGKTTTGRRLNLLGSLRVLDPSIPQVTEDEQTGPSEHARTITLSLKRHLVAVGRVSVDDGFKGCRNGVPVMIKRNGVKVAQVSARSDGSFKAQLKDRTGRYVAIASQVNLIEDTCPKAKSAVVKHKH